jgi:hypothetical protein
MSRRRERESGKGLLPLMEARPWKDGETVTYRYHPLGGKPVNLGTDREAAILEVLRLNRAAPDSGTVAELWRLYQQTTDWADLKEASRVDYTQSSAELLRVFGGMTPTEIRALHVRRYLRQERAAAPVRANREAALLSNLLNVAIDRGDVDANVCRQVRRNKERPRSRAPEPPRSRASSRGRGRAAARRRCWPAWPSSPRCRGTAASNSANSAGRRSERPRSACAARSSATRIRSSRRSRCRRRWPT